jgi:hypothetical protein
VKGLVKGRHSFIQRFNLSYKFVSLLFYVFVLSAVWRLCTVTVKEKENGPD